MEDKVEITKPHLDHFMNILREIDTVISIDFLQFDKNLQQIGHQFPSKGNGCMVLATNSTDRDACHPYQPMIGFASPPHYLSSKVPIMEFSLSATFDQDGEPASLTPIATAVFPCGRRVITVYGLTLDTSGEKTKYEQGTMMIDHDAITLNPLNEAIVMQLLTAFPAIEGSKEQACLKSAMEDYNRNTPLAS